MVEMVLRQFSTIGLAALAALFINATRGPSADTRSASKRGRTAKAAPATETGDTGADAGNTPTEIVIHRRRIHLRAPEKYQVPIHLDPVRTVRLAAPFDGTVKSIVHKPGDHLESSAEVIRMDLTEKQLRLDRAKALYQVAKLEDEEASGKAKQLTAARLQAAKADLDLAVYWTEQGVLRAPFNCEVLRVDVSEGQIVRMGEPLATLGDTSALAVEIPVDRNSTKAGQPIEIKIEDRTVPATVDAILPLAARFEALRDLIPSAASAMVIVPNTDGRLRPGQTVFSPLIPRDVVADVPNSCIANSPDGNHKVQVLRNNVIRDVPIATLAAVGPDRTFISGAFDPTDEVIESATPELADGTVVRPSPPAPQLQEAARPGSTARSHTRPPSTETPAPEAPSKPSGI
jgi:multidrug efflux pump subunit AcrA (membrane-fusion protein)